MCTTAEPDKCRRLMEVDDDSAINLAIPIPPNALLSSEDVLVIELVNVLQRENVPLEGSPANRPDGRLVLAGQVANVVSQMQRFRCNARITVKGEDGSVCAIADIALSSASSSEVMLQESDISQRLEAGNFNISRALESLAAEVHNSGSRSSQEISTLRKDCQQQHEIVNDLGVQLQEAEADAKSFRSMVPSKDAVKEFVADQFHVVQSNHAEVMECAKRNTQRCDKLNAQLEASKSAYAGIHAALADINGKRNLDQNDRSSVFDVLKECLGPAWEKLERRVTDLEVQVKSWLGMEAEVDMGSGFETPTRQVHSGLTPDVPIPDNNTNVFGASSSTVPQSQKGKGNSLTDNYTILLNGFIKRIVLNSTRYLRLACEKNVSTFTARKTHCKFQYLVLSHWFGQLRHKNPVDTHEQK